MNRAALESRADQIRASLDLRPAPVADPRDLVIAIDGHPEPWVIAPERALVALSLLGGSDFADEVLGWSVAANCVLLVIVIDGWIQVTQIGVRLLSAGGDA